jgi:hypothetical protein
VLNAIESLRVTGSATTCPVATCSAAMIETVPLRTYSNSRRGRRPGRGGRSHHGARRAQVNIAYCGCLRQELVVIGPVQPAADPVRPQLQVSQDPASTDGYADAVLLDGHFTGHPAQALDTTKERA